MFESQITTIFSDMNLPGISKIVLLLIIGLYWVFTFFVYTKIVALDKIVFFPGRFAATFLKTLALGYVFLILSLFFLALVIL